MKNATELQIHFSIGVFYFYAIVLFFPALIYIIACFFNLISSMRIYDYANLEFIVFCLACFIVARGLSVRSIRVLKFALFLCILMFVWGIWGLQGSYAEYVSSRIWMPENLLLGIILGVPSPLFLVIIYFLTRPKVKEQFK
jgi:hypothetical protein